MVKNAVALVVTWTGYVQWCRQQQARYLVVEQQYGIAGGRYRAVWCNRCGEGYNIVRRYRLTTDISATRHCQHPPWFYGSEGNAYSRIVFAIFLLCHQRRHAHAYGHIIRHNIRGRQFHRHGCWRQRRSARITVRERRVACCSHFSSLCRLARYWRNASEGVLLMLPGTS